MSLKGRTFVINLDRRVDRYNIFLGRFAGFGFEHERFSGVDGLGLRLGGGLEKILNQKLLENPRNPKVQLPGLLGCWLSHYYLWEKLSLDEGHDFYVIFEDDVYFTGDFEDRFGDILDAVNNNFDIYYLGGRYRESFMPRNLNVWVPVRSGDVTFYYSRDRSSLGHDFDRGLFSYVVTKEGAKKLLKLFDYTLSNFKGIAAVDGWINENRNSIHVCDVFPHVTWAKIGESSDIR